MSCKLDVTANRFGLRPWLVSASLVIALLTTSYARASVLEIQISGLHLTYDGTSLFDAGVHNTARSGNPAEATSLTALEFFLDDVLVGSLESNVFADLYIANLQNIPVGGGAVSSSGNGDAFGLDLLTSNANPGWGLALNIDTMDFFYTGMGISVTLAGVASDLVTQILPFDLAFDWSQPITIVLSSASLTNITNDGTFLTGFNASGTGNVAGTGYIIPEPSSVVIAGLGVLGLVACGLRRRR